MTMVGDRLGPDEIATEIGSGGMGAVYRATDTRLDRAVAIKVTIVVQTVDAKRFLVACHPDHPGRFTVLMNWIAPKVAASTTR